MTKASDLTPEERDQMIRAAYKKWPWHKRLGFWANQFYIVNWLRLVPFMKYQACGCGYRFGKWIICCRTHLIVRLGLDGDPPSQIQTGQEA